MDLKNEMCKQLRDNYPLNFRDSKKEVLVFPRSGDLQNREVGYFRDLVLYRNPKGK